MTTSAGSSHTDRDWAAARAEHAELRRRKAEAAARLKGTNIPNSVQGSTKAGDTGFVNGTFNQEVHRPCPQNLKAMHVQGSGAGLAVETILTCNASQPAGPR